jgi:hypothetical protein
LGSKGNAPFILCRNTGTAETPVWTEIDRVGVPNELDPAYLKPGETDIDSYTGAYTGNPNATSKGNRGWNRGRTWTRNPGQNAKPGTVNQITEATINRSSWSALADQKAQYKLDITNTGNDPRNGGWTQIGVYNSATSDASAFANTTLGWHEWSVPLQ